MNQSQKAVFFDRDGVINSLIKRKDDRVTSPWKVSEFVFLPYVFESIAMIQKQGFKTFIVTNQPGIYYGDMTEADLFEINMMLHEKLSVDGIDCATDLNSYDYKPNNGMLEKNIIRHNLDRSNCYIIGDRWKDIVPGYNSKITTIYVGDQDNYNPIEKYKQIKPDYLCEDILEACKLIMELDNARV
jgi:D-glycero-D-manno-heptose 1,7-bisphosphate phosphatase